MKAPLISILMPVKNYAQYLPACLESIRAQSCTDWELLAVNDHSDDQTPEILQAFAKRDPRIRPLNNEGRGLIPALRTAFRHSRGKLLTRMDADDLMPPQKLRLLSEKLLQSGPGHLALGLVEYFCDPGETLGNGYRQYAQWLNELISQNRIWQQIYRECTVPSSAWMCRREDLMACHAFEPDVYPEDYDLCFRFYAHGLQTAPVRRLVHLWRDHGLRISRTHEHYADHTFLDLKLPWFLKTDYDPQRPLVLYGAGKKGKRLASMLHERNIPFHWLCNTPSKWGKEMYDTRWHPPAFLGQLKHPQLIFSVAQRDARQSLREMPAFKNLEEGKDFFAFT